MKEFSTSMTSTEILNKYRNMYYKESDERGIVAMAINEILPEYIEYKEAKENGVVIFLSSDLVENINVDQLSSCINYAICMLKYGSTPICSDSAIEMSSALHNAYIRGRADQQAIFDKAVKHMEKSQTRRSTRYDKRYN